MTRMGTDKKHPRNPRNPWSKSLLRLNVLLSPQACERRRTSELSHAGNKTTNDRDYKDQLKRLTGVGSGDLVRRRAHPTSKIPGQLGPNSPRRPACHSTKKETTDGTDGHGQKASA